MSSLDRYSRFLNKEPRGKEVVCFSILGNGVRLWGMGLLIQKGSKVWSAPSPALSLSFFVFYFHIERVLCRAHISRVTEFFLCFGVDAYRYFPYVC